MLPFIFEIGSFKLYSYGAAMIFAFTLCLILTLKMTPRSLLSTQDIYNFCLIIMASLLFGTKLMYFFVSGNFNLQSFAGLFKFWQRGSFSFLPAFSMAVVLILIYCKYRRIPLLETLDHLLPIAILGVALQRIFGCFLAGCCYGAPTKAPWGIVFPEVCRAGRHYPGIHLHPTQLYYGFTSLFLFILLILFKKKFTRPGKPTAIGLMLLSASYFLITFFRGDIPESELHMNLSYSQYMTIVIFSMGLLILLRNHICKLNIGRLAKKLKERFQ